MPPLGKILDDAQVAEVVNYIRTHFGNAYAEDPATPGMVAASRRGYPSGGPAGLTAVYLSDTVPAVIDEAADKNSV